MRARWLTQQGWPLPSPASTMTGTWWDWWQVPIKADDRTSLLDHHHSSSLWTIRAHNALCDTSRLALWLSCGCLHKEKCIWFLGVYTVGGSVYSGYPVACQSYLRCLGLEEEVANIINKCSIKILCNAICLCLNKTLELQGISSDQPFKIGLFNCIY